MNSRRQFIKRGALFVPALFVPKLIRAQSGTWADYALIGNAGSGYVWDADALDFISRASITDGTQKLAIDQLAKALKAASIWTKLDAVYPFVGGNATAHSENLKGNTFDISWTGGVTHDANGITGNGSTGVGDTGWNPSTAAGQDDVTCAIYSRTQTPTTNRAFFSVVRETGGSGSSRLQALFNGSTPVSNCNDNTASAVGASADCRGFIGFTRSAAAAYTSQQRGTQNGLNVTSVAAINTTMTVLARHWEGFAPDVFSDINLAFAAFGNALSTGELSSLQTAVVNYQTALGRNV